MATDSVIIILLNLLSCLSSTDLEDVMEPLFSGPELGKPLLTLASGGILATPAIYYNHILPQNYLYLITLMLFVAFFSLFSAIALRQTFPYPAAILGLIGTACVVIVIPTITAGVLPKLRVVVWLLFSLLPLIPILLVLLTRFLSRRHRSQRTAPVSDSETGAAKGLIDPSTAEMGIKVDKGVPSLLVPLAHLPPEGSQGTAPNSDAATETGDGQGLIEPSTAQIEIKLEIPEQKMVHSTSSCALQMESK